jgi:mono/diheme cytochrome c family protein
MNQIKYLVYACLMILTFVIIGFCISPILSTKTVTPETTIIDTDVSQPVIVNSKGSNLFRQNCQSCHALDKNLTGPALRGVEERGPWTERQNLIKWVRNPATFIPTTPYTKELQKQYVQIMPSFPQLSDEDIHAIFDYITKYSAPSSMPVALR